MAHHIRDFLAARACAQTGLHQGLAGAHHRQAHQEIQQEIPGGRLPPTQGVVPYGTAPFVVRDPGGGR